MKLKDLVFGKNDGKKEAKLINDFDKYFYDPENIFSKLKEPARYLILGRKGSGKTILAYYFMKKIKDENELNLCSITSLKNAKYFQLASTPEDENNPNQYYSIWKWILLVSLANIVLKYQGIENSREFGDLYNFIYKELGLGKISFEKLIEKSSKATYEVSVKYLKAQYETEKKKVPVTFEELIEPLLETLLNCVALIDSHIALFIDEIDDKYRNLSKSKNVLISLIKATDELNTSLLDSNDKCKIYLLVRTDIYDTLIDSDLEKINQDSSIRLDWETRFDYKSPVFLLALNKIKQSVSEFKNRNLKYIYENYFMGSLNDDTDPAKYMLNRTMIRPRDIITYFNLMIEDNPESESFTLDNIKLTEGKYSKYLVGEVKNELISHFKEEYIDTIIFVIKAMKKNYFHKIDIENALQKKPGSENINSSQILMDMFEFSLIGYEYEDIVGKPHYRFRYRDSSAPFLAGETYVIHPGLRKELSR